MNPRCLALLAALPLAAQISHYRFHIDQDALSGAPDFSFLNQPLTAADRLFVRDGHFYRIGADLTPNTADDERVRLFGMNLAFGANFPTAEDAPRIARRLRRLGVNLVRLHHMDTQPDANPANAGSVLTTGPYPTFNPVAMERLRGFLDALRNEGIYANVNLHVGYTFRPSVDSIPPATATYPTQSKPLHILHPALIDLQRKFTRELLTGLALKDDPVLGMVEINNESSLLYAWQTSQLDAYLVGDYAAATQLIWNEFLRTRYVTTDALRAAWGDTQPAGPELLPANWQPLEIHAPATGSVETLADGVVKVTVERGGAALILKKTGFSVAESATYEAEVEMRADLAAGQSRNVYWDIKQDVSPWRTMRSTNAAVTGQWRKFRMVFSGTFAMDKIGRFGLSVEAVDAPLYVRNATLRLASLRGLNEGETLEAGNVGLVTGADAGTRARTDDYLLYLAGRDRDYLNSLLSETRAATGALVPVTGTQMGYGGLLNIDSHAGLDYMDEHFYIDHYNFPNVSWDGRDWRIRDASSLGSGLSTFLRVATNRPGLQPYTVSEFNQPWPNSYAAEIDPTLAAFGAFQDWDAIVHFAYSHGRGWDDGVPNGFNMNGDWTKFPGAGQAAWLFRSGAITTGLLPVDLPVPAALRLRAARERRNGAISDFLLSAGGYKAQNAFLHPVRLRPDLDAPLPAEATATPPQPLVSDTGELTYDAPAKLFVVASERAAGVFGFTSRAKVTAGPIDVELLDGARGFAAVLLTPLDGMPIRDSRRLLLSNPGPALRTQPGALPERPQMLMNYGNTADWWTLEREPAYQSKPSGNLNGGIRPVYMERVEASVTLRTAAQRISVYPLDGSGQRLAPLTSVTRLDDGFLLNLQAEGQDFSAWYEIVVEE